MVVVCCVCSMLCCEDEALNEPDDDDDDDDDDDAVCPQCTVRGLDVRGSQASAAARRPPTVRTSPSTRRSCVCLRSRERRSFCSVTLTTDSSMAEGPRDARTSRRPLQNRTRSGV